METKECKTCHAIKPINEFHKHPQYADGYDSTCGECAEVSSAKREDRNRRTNSQRIVPRRFTLFIRILSWQSLLLDNLWMNSKQEDIVGNYNTLKR